MVIVERLHHPTRQRSAQDAGERHRRHEHGHDLAAPVRRKPIRQVKDDAGIEAGLGRAQQEAQDVELGRRLRQRHGGRDQAPQDHDARQRLLRADAVHQHVAWHFEQEVADKEDARAQAVDRFAELEVVQHLQFGEADVHAVQERRDVAHHQEWQQAPRHLPVQRIVPRQGVLVRGNRGSRNALD
ncbi:hypothetical protein D3C72_1212130 [compost metagenome]